ncbi:MAG: hypothetical protein II095_03545 [Bacteroidales bacterium]|jgi:hypothetical protein|nr:hypothetical protein [Bacteroidales bacterium]MBR4568469.1 hypothetical protein [Bacteroidales bacterium]
MKRLIVLVAALLLALSAYALEPVKKDKSKMAVEGYGHISKSEGVNYSAGGAFIWGKQRTKGFFLGAGTGLRYIHSVHEIEELGEGSRILYYGDEAVVPVFIRARFGRVRPGKIKPFVTADIGTALNFGKEANTKGFFFEPQIGLDLAENVYVTLGVDTHHFLSRRLIRVGDVIGTIRDPEKKVKGIMSTGLSLHVGYSF